jgi:hypothetical protein
MNGWKDGWVDGWMEGWMDGWVNGLTDRQTERQIDRSVKAADREKEQKIRLLLVAPSSECLWSPSRFATTATKTG